MESKTPSEARMRRVRRRRWCAGRSGVSRRCGRVSPLRADDEDLGGDMSYLLCSARSMVRSEWTVRSTPEWMRHRGGVPASSQRPHRQLVVARALRYQGLSRRECGEVCRRCYWEVRHFAWPHLLVLAPVAGFSLHRGPILPGSLLYNPPRCVASDDALRVPSHSWI